MRPFRHAPLIAVILISLSSPARAQSLRGQFPLETETVRIEDADPVTMVYENGITETMTDRCELVPATPRGTVSAYWDCLFPITDKDRLYHAAGCRMDSEGVDHCSEFVPEANLVCRTWEGSDGCPTDLLPYVEAP